MFYPPIPISFVLSGDKAVAATLHQEGRKRAGELYDFLSGGYGDPHRDAVEDRLFSGKSGPFYYLTKSGYLVTIRVKIAGELTYVYTDAISRGEAVVSLCECCRDCLSIGTVVEKIYVNSPPYDIKYIVDLCVSVDNGAPAKVRLIDGAYPADGNPSFEPGDKYLVFATPALWSPLESPATENHLSTSTNLKTWQGVVDAPGVDTFYFRQPRAWQLFNCMQLSSVQADVDLSSVGLDNTIYTEGGEACTRAVSGVLLEDPATSQSDPIPALPLRFFLSSFQVKNCFKMSQ